MKTNSFLDGIGLPQPKERPLEEALESGELEDDDVLDIENMQKRGSFKTPWVPIAEDDSFVPDEFIELE
jgi:hypothetical protein